MTISNKRGLNEEAKHQGPFTRRTKKVGVTAALLECELTNSEYVRLNRSKIFTGNNESPLTWELRTNAALINRSTL